MPATFLLSAFGDEITADLTHIKDAVFADGSVRPAGQGEGAITPAISPLSRT